MFQRIIKVPKSNSFFLFGARGTGKSTLLHTLFNETNSIWFDLLIPETESMLMNEPSRMREIWKKSQAEWIVIDEVQKLPKLLDLVHSMIETEGVKFALTGSSARKLRHGQANLLAGRAFSFRLFPLCQIELKDDFDLEKALSLGTLPKVMQYSDSQDAVRFLVSYCQTYLKEEIQVEQLVRNVEPFRKFLPVAAHSHGRPLNYSKIGRDAGVDPKSVERYFSILEDTLLGFFLDSYQTRVRKRQKISPKFYFFDLGIQRALGETLDVKINEKISYYGEMFEAFLIAEIYRLHSYHESQSRMSYLQTSDGLEIDLILEKAGRVRFLIEIKSSKSIDNESLRALKSCHKDFPEARRIVLCNEILPRITSDGIEIFPWKFGIQELFI